jgi:hypothetical protein
MSADYNNTAEAPVMLLHAQKSEKDILGLNTTLIHIVSLFLALMFVGKNISSFSFYH